MIKIVHPTSRGQITLPKTWREKADTEYFEMEMRGEELIIKPLRPKKDLQKETEESWQEYLQEGGIDHEEVKKRYAL